MSLSNLEKQICIIRELLRIGQNQKTLRVYCIRLVAMMEKRKALTAGTVTAS